MNIFWIIVDPDQVLASDYHGHYANSGFCLETIMSTKHATQVIECPIRHREVEVTYSASGGWFNRSYQIEWCPAMYDGGVGCDRRCATMLNRPSIQLIGELRT